MTDIGTFVLGGLFPFSMGIVAVFVQFTFFVLDATGVVFINYGYRFSKMQWMLVFVGTAFGGAVMLNRLDVAYQILDWFTVIF